MALSQLAIVPIEERDVEVAWATYRALLLAQHDDRSLLDNAAHQQAVEMAHVRFNRLFNDWMSH